MGSKGKRPSIATAADVDKLPTDEQLWKHPYRSYARWSVNCGVGISFLIKNLKARGWDRQVGGGMKAQRWRRAPCADCGEPVAIALLDLKRTCEACNTRDQRRLEHRDPTTLSAAEHYRLESRKAKARRAKECEKANRVIREIIEDRAQRKRGATLQDNFRSMPE